MKALLSTLLGLMLTTSTLVGIVYATPIVQPQGSGDINACVNLTPNNPNYISLGCGGAAHQDGNGNPPAHGNSCADPSARVGSDEACCVEGRIAPDITCCDTGITPHSFEVSDIQADTFCGPV